MHDEPEHIPCWQRLAPDLTTSGRLDAEAVETLGKLGVRHVINLALADSPGALPNEAELLEQSGIGYSHIPIPFGAPEDSHYTAFRAALERADRPVHVHCIMNWRVSACFYRHNRDSGMAEAEARALLERQWSPESHAHPDAPAWARFIAQAS